MKQNKRDCEHGNLKRCCIICQYEQDIKRLEKELARVKRLLARNTLNVSGSKNDKAYWRETQTKC